MHTHELYGKNKETVDPVSLDFSRQCIDSGADAVIGTGPHLLRPMEIYKGKPIFYCLGDFIIQLETILRAPDGMFAKQKLNGNERLDVLFNTRSDFGKRGLSYDPVMYEAVIPYWETENGELTKMIFMPVEEMFALPRSRSGWPRKDTDANIIERFAEMSKPYGMDIRIENGLGVVKL
jgi:poly-gamma-glutamate synthesis protein (capsule biosynthesis protein)